ncbi:hypothetical protein HYV50_02955 [Candidatus Pacearchaeota archaeon]|nr:hypothetical protein [Candidatus Pacearchaeota archaeon]
MLDKKRGQISVEYLIVISFVTFVALSILGIALFYSAEIKDSIKFSQLEQFAKKITSSAERIYYSGEPSRTTISAYLPEGVQAVTIQNKDIIFNVSTSSGTSVIAYSSNVPIQGTITPTPGVKKIKLEIKSNPERVELTLV